MELNKKVIFLILCYISSTVAGNLINYNLIKKMFLVFQNETKVSVVKTKDFNRQETYFLIKSSIFVKF